MSKIYRILSLDGGPSTINYLRLLRVIEENRPGFLDRADLLAGTSDGAWAALFIATRPPGTTGLEALNQCIAFNEKIADALKLGIVGVVRLLTGVMSAINNQQLVSQLKEIYGNDVDGNPHTLKTLHRDVCLVAYHLNRQPVKPGVRLFHNLERHGDSDLPDVTNEGKADLELPAYEVALRSGAFPIMMPARQGYIDGAMFANNPGMCGLTQAHAYREALGFANLDHCVMLSAGADDVHLGGKLLEWAEREHKDLQWGWAPWLLMPWAPLILVNAMMSASGRGVGFQTRELLGQRFLRLAPPMGEPFGREMLRFIEGRRRRLFEEADTVAADWAAGATGINATPTLALTLAWLDRVWFTDPKMPDQPTL